MAPKRFFTGSTSLMILSASTVSARMEPMTNAPKAELKPTRVEKTAMRQQSPSDTMSSVSLLMSRRTERRKRGMAKMPVTNHSTRKKPIFSTLCSICEPSGLLPPAMAESITIMTMARISSRMSTLITMPANCCWRRPISSKALYMMVVELIESIPPRKIQSIRFQPKACPTVMPSVIMHVMMMRAAMTGDEPMRRIFLMEKSSPKEKSRR